MPLKNGRNGKKIYFDFKWKNVFPTSKNGSFQYILTLLASILLCDLAMVENVTH
jgi:hypothetical protein